MKAARTGWWRAGAFAVGIALAAVPLSAASGSGTDSPHTALAPLLGVHQAGKIAGHYVVVLDDNASEAGLRSATATATAAGGTIGFTYHAALKGFSASLSSAALSAVRSAAGVKYVEADGRVHLTKKQTNPPSWGLDRVDQRSLPLDHKYKYPGSAGAGVTAYGIDTGMRFTHTDFGGRASSGFDAVDGGSADDCNGHGTHTAGTMGGSTYGVAKKVTLVAVRVLDCGGSGTWAGVIAGIDWVTDNHSGPSVANMSLGGGHMQSVDDAVTASINSGVVYAVSAGNNATDACSQSPASTPLAITVGATEINDARASYSNYGTCLDLFGPGSSITSDWNSSDTATNTISGTSMATPHVAGTAALYLSLHPSASPQQVRDAIVNNATDGKVTNPGTGSPNKLLYSKVNKYN
jgi:subtilisin family serine protease